MKRTWQMIGLLVLILITISSVRAEIITYDYDDGTLQGWTNDSKATETMVAWDTSANNNGGRTVARSGNFMVIESNFDDRDSDTNVQLLSSPPFLLTSDASIEIWTLGGTGSTPAPTWTNYADLPAAASSDGFMGAALRRVSDGEYLLFSRRSASSQGSSWLSIGWDAAEIYAATESDSYDETYVVDIIDTYTGSWGWISADDITLENVVPADLDTVAFLEQPVKQIAPVGNNVTFNALAYAASGTVQYEWFKEGNGNDVLSQTSELTFEVTEQSGGYYYCVASDGQGDSVTSELAEMEIGDCLGIPQGDINADCKVDLLDVALLLQEWLVDNLVVPTCPPFDYIYAAYLNSLSDTVQIVAHRGDGFGDPENSLAAFKSCIQGHVDVIETDVRKTLDGYLVLMHDSTINRTTNGSGSVSSLTLEQIKSYYLKNPNGTLSDEKVPTLEEAMLTVKGKCMVNLDKAWGIRAECLAVLQQTDTVDQAIFKSSGDAATLKSQIDALGAEINFMLMDNSTDINSILDKIDIIQASAIEISFSDDTHPVMLPENIALIRQHGARVWINTLWGGSLSGGHPDNSTTTWDWMVQRGVTMMQTDYPAAMLEYLQSIDRHP